MAKKTSTVWILGLVIAGSLTSQAQALYRRPTLDELAAIADDNGVLPQPYLALTNANVVDVRGWSILRGVTIVLRSGKIVSVGAELPPADAASAW